MTYYHESSYEPATRDSLEKKKSDESLRDFFAGCALIGFALNPEAKDIWCYEGAAKRLFMWADAMMEEREK